MAAPYSPPIKAEDFKIRISLTDMNAAGSFKANPTIAAGDFKIDKDGAGFNNLATLPTVSPAGGVAVLLELSTTEMNADLVTIVGIDQTNPKEWADFVLCIPTVAALNDASAGSIADAVWTEPARTITGAEAGAIAASSLASDMNKYQAKLWVVDDNTGTNDRYMVAWYKNGEPITSGITSPTIQVYKQSDGTDLIASTAMTEIGSSGTYKKDEGTNRMVSGAGYIAKVQATIDGGTRTWLQPVSRDS